MQQLRFYSPHWLYSTCFGRQLDDNWLLCSKHIVITDAIVNLQWAGLPVAIYSICTPDDGWDCRPKHVKSKAIAENKNSIVASCLTYFTTIKFPSKQDILCQLCQLRHCLLQWMLATHFATSIFKFLYRLTDWAWLADTLNVVIPLS